MTDFAPFQEFDTRKVKVKFFPPNRLWEKYVPPSESWGEPLYCEPNLKEDRADILAWEKDILEWKDFDVSEGRKPIAECELNERVAKLVQERTDEEAARQERVNDGEVIIAPRPQKVRAFTPSELDTLVKAREALRRPYYTYYNGPVVSCEESANALVILNAMKKRYQNPRNMHREIWRPGGYMFYKTWDALVQDVAHLEGDSQAALLTATRSTIYDEGDEREHRDVM